MDSSAAHRAIGALLGATAALACLTAAGPAYGAGPSAATPPAAAGYEPAGAVRQAAADDGGESREVLDYWTPRRMAEAAPLVPALNGIAGGVLPDGGTPGATGATAPQAAAGSSTGDPWREGGQVTRTTGKVFLTMNGRDFTCSASVVSADNRDTVITAGHCLKDGSGPWADKWVFVPGYANGENPYGRYTARQMFVAPQWADGPDDSYDFGMAVLNRSGGEHVQDRVGAQPIAFGTEPADPSYSFGYPATGRFEGRRLHYCSGRPVDDNGGTTANGMACGMTEGSSGGPWLSGFDSESGKGTVVSVISFKYADDARTQYGPFLGEAARRLYDRARGY